MKASEIAKIVDGKLYGNPDDFARTVYIDTRKPVADGIFIALKGEKFDGNDFLGEVGAKIVIASRYQKTQNTLILVDNTQHALLKLAANHRKKHPIPIVAVTGSVGKTTTKEFIYNALSKKYCVFRNQGNYNNHIGMPLSLLSVDDHEIAVLEMGMSDLMEIHKLSMTAKPTIAVITNIGVSHIEKLGSMEKILQAKLEILDGLADDGVVILNGDDPMLSNLQLPYKTLTYGINNPNATINATKATAQDFELEGKKVTVPIVGQHNIYNALAAILVAKTLGVDQETAIKGLSAYKSDGIRQSLKHLPNNITVMTDCYNASPTSVKAALTAVKTLPGSRHIAILGDMLELGEEAQSLHNEIGEAVHAHQYNALFTLGPLSAHTTATAKAKGIPHAHNFKTPQALLTALTSYLKPHDTILIKGSRAMRMEEIAAKLEKDEG